jgi:dienelactone hydrolase
LRRPLLLAVAVLLLAAPSAAASDDPLGVGASQVWVLRPQGPVRSVVVFLHGWGAMAPEGIAWIDHLRAHGNVVVYPRYQADVSDRATSTIYRLRDGLRTAFAEPDLQKRPVITLGHSWGATLAFRHGSNARLWGVPVPRAIVAMNPASTSYGGPPKNGPPRSVRVLLMVGDSDSSGPARTYWRWLGHHPKARKELRIIESKGAFIADHGSPMQTTPAARRAYWAPVDAVIAQARRA